VPDTPVLSVDGLTAAYGSVVVLWDVTFDVHRGEIVAILGANGAGKTSLLRSLANQTRRVSGDVSFDGEPTASRSADTLARSGLVLVPEGRGLIPFMSVAENLQLGLDARRSAAQDWERSLVSEMFPILERRRDQLAGDLSGGEQQMLAIARAMLMRPRCLMLDEPSQGLAPKIVEDIFRLFRNIREQLEITVLLVEQNVSQALKVADRAYVLERGRIVMAGDSAQLRDDPAVREAYLGGEVHR
jgi:branched-chain amino acid transport system ATP-binding protein